MQNILKTTIVGLILVTGISVWAGDAVATSEPGNACVVTRIPFDADMKGWTRSGDSNAVFAVQQTAKGAVLRVQNKVDTNALISCDAHFPLRPGWIYSWQAFYTMTGQISNGLIQLCIIPMDAEGKEIARNRVWINSFTPTTDWKLLIRANEWVPPTNAASAQLMLYFKGQGTFQVTSLELKEKRAESITFNGKTFFFTPRNKEKDPRLGWENWWKRWKGVLFYQRDPRMVYPDSVPQSGEIVKKVVSFGTPGERKGVSFMVYALRNLDLLGVKLADPLTNDNGEIIPMENVTIKEIKFWPQRAEEWDKSLAYYIIPELLEESPESALPAGMNRGFWLDVKTPSGLVAGDYKSEIIVNTGGGKPIKLPVCLEIMPFELMSPTNFNWLLSAEVGAFGNDRKGQPRRFLLDVKEYGINSITFNTNIALMNEIGLNNGPMQVNVWSTAEVEDRVAKRMGIKPDAPTENLLARPISMQPFELAHCRYVSSLKNNKDFRDACGTEAAAWFKAMGLTNTLYMETGHEPIGGNVPLRLPATLLRCEYLNVAGVKTFCYCYYYELLEQLAPYGLDAAISNGGHVQSEEDNRRWRELADKHNTQLWYVGGGCYERQEGGLMPDRYLAGFLSYKSGSDAHVSWTYQRPKNDPFNDFDAEENEEPKDYCITYPARNPSDRCVSISTLQWEGIREGIIDYKYLYTLKHYIEHARAKGHTDLADEGQKVFDTILKAIPWKCDYHPGDYYLSPGNFDNNIADALRLKAARQIEKIVAALNRL